MKEHSLFLEAGFAPANADFARSADRFKEQFESVLQYAVRLGDGIISPVVRNSGELLTDFTLSAEEATDKLSGIKINTDITKAEERMHGSLDPEITPELISKTAHLNKSVLPLIEALINFKKKILGQVLSCRMFTMNYPLLIEHILREAELYKSYIEKIENYENAADSLKDTELFWDRIMMEHALFIRGLLDPSETELIKTADGFAEDYEALLRQAVSATDAVIKSNIGSTLRQTEKYRDFKAAGTAGIEKCKIKSIIIPLLADHVLREANHYIRLLHGFE
jgi:hypothetical protein